MRRMFVLHQNSGGIGNLGNPSPLPSRFPSILSVLGKSLGHGGWISQYLPRFGGTRIQSLIWCKITDLVEAYFPSFYTLPLCTLVLGGIWTRELLILWPPDHYLACLTSPTHLIQFIQHFVSSMKLCSNSAEAVSLIWFMRLKCRFPAIYGPRCGILNRGFLLTRMRAESTSSDESSGVKTLRPDVDS